MKCSKRISKKIIKNELLEKAYQNLTFKVEQRAKSKEARGKSQEARGKRHIKLA